MTLWERLGNQAPAYLEGKNALDESFYARLFDRRISRDLELLADEEFRNRYITGYELAPVPRFRTDVAGWDEFVESLARQICLDQTRPRSQSRLLWAIREAIDQANAKPTVLDDSTHLMKFLRKVWQGANGSHEKVSASAKIIADYHRL